MSNEPQLQRRLSVGLLTLYGLGTTIGAGIYALTGEVAGRAGMAAPWSFLIASSLAGLSALSFSELSARFPKSAGEALYVREGLRSETLATTVGLLVSLAGVVSAATVANGFVGYMAELTSLPRPLLIVAFILVLGGVSAWGIGESVRLAGLITLIEVGGILLVVWGARDGLGDMGSRFGEMLPGAAAGWGAAFAGALLAFYAFLGFEDMVNVAEEVKNVRRAMPVAILSTLGLSSLLYLIVASAAVLTVPPAELAASGAPLALVWERTTGGSSAMISVIGVLAMVNGALIQLIMAPRVLYGLARQGALPPRLGRVNARTRTPLLATSIATGVALILALFFPLGPLAAATSAITLAIFALVNAALWRLKRREPTPEGVISVPVAVPIAGMIVTAAFLAMALSSVLWG